MNPIEKFKESINNKGYKKIIYNFLTLIIICIIALIVWDTFLPNSMNTATKGALEKVDVKKDTNWKSDYQESAEIQLKDILKEIKGVGEVNVMITYESSAEVVPASNVTKTNELTEEKDAQGGSRTTTHEDLTENIVTSNDSNKLVVIKEIKPQVRGVVIVAQGAGDIKIKTELIEAVRTIFQIPAYKVMVYEKK